MAYKDIGVELAGFVATIEIRRPPHNYFDVALINEIADALDTLDADTKCRAVVLAAPAGPLFGLSPAPVEFLHYPHDALPLQV